MVVSYKMSDVETEAYVVHAKADRSTSSGGTQAPRDALERTHEMAWPSPVMTITGRDGSKHTIEEAKTNIPFGQYAASSSAR